ncbi:MAG: hypothetical protein Tsb0020_00410 [Haliangiales bacterium]
MQRPVRVCFWTTSFGPDLIALGWDLDAHEDFELRVAVDDPAAMMREPSLQRRPLKAPLVDKGLAGMRALRRFAPDVVVIDNGPPWWRLGRAGLVLWHGYGWKGPNDLREMAYRYLSLAAQWGSPLHRNRRLRWACFGPQDKDHRVGVGRLSRDVCVELGATSHDVLRAPIDRAELASAYPIDVVTRRNVLIAPTWHYGGVLGHWGDERAMLERLFERVRDRGANVILRLHDKWRMEPALLAVVEGLARRHDHVLLKFKNEHPDGLADLQIADVLITNMSSIANLFYATGRPTIHVFPVRDEQETFAWRRLWFGKVRAREVGSVREIWKLRPERNGGLMARSQEQLLAQVDQALDDPGCCAEAAKRFVDDYMLGADGRACERARATLQQLAGH